MKIGKLRKKLKEKKFLEKKYDELTKKAHHWNSFLKFECSTFLRGYERAERNQRIYNKEIKKLRRQINFIKALMQI
jgi:hypothetical protein